MTQRQTPQTYYSSHGIMTAPGAFAHLLDGLPTGIPALCKVIQGLLMHPFETELYEVDLTSIQRREVYIRTVAEMLSRIHSIDDQPLTVTRPPDERLVGNCRDHAVLFCSFLRQAGIPARTRVGFATYFGRGFNYNHWVTEFWDESQQKWIMVDSQIDEAQRLRHEIDFDTLDLPSGKFIPAGLAWKLCRSDAARSGEFGQSRKARGWDYIRATVTQELASLNKVEVIPWDVWWELGSKPGDQLRVEDREYVDQISAALCAGDEGFEAIRSIYNDDPQFSQMTETKLRLLGITADPHISELSLRPSESERLVEMSKELSTIRSQLSVSNSVDDNNLKPFSSKQSSVIDRSVSSGSSILDPSVITIRGASQHNLKHIDINLPRYKMIVLTGVSGSGKSSLAFDTLYAEGQRRYVESLSSYVRRYLDQMDKPKVDYIGGLSPAIAIEQKSISRNPRSTVGTVTEVMDYLRVLFSRAGTQHCPQCGRAVEPLGAQQIADRLAVLPPGTRLQLIAPLQRDRKGDHHELIRKALSEGYTRLRIDTNAFDLSIDNVPSLKKSEKHTIEVIIDRLVVPETSEQFTVNCEQSGSASISPAIEEWNEYKIRLIDSIETCLRAGKGHVVVELGSGEQFRLTEHNTCPYCEITLPKLTATLFSFNSPTGMCPECNGLGTTLDVDPALIIEHPELSLLDGASRWYGNIRKKKGSKYWLGNLESMAAHYNVDLNLPWKDLPQIFRDVVLYGSGDEKITFKYENEGSDHSFHGELVRPVKGTVYNINRLFRQTKSDYTRRFYLSFMNHQPCTACKGTRLNVEARYVTIGSKTFPDVLSMTIERAYQWIGNLLGIRNEVSPAWNLGRSQEEIAESEGDSELDPQSGGNGSSREVYSTRKPTNYTPSSPLTNEQLEVVGEVLKEIHSRLSFMLNVGLHYLTLERPAPTLSGGEGQRIRLASQLGCGLVGVLYILDEPSIGLHARDQHNLIDTLLNLRDMGNTVLVVEHDAETMRRADWLVDLGPGAGVNGGWIVSAGTPDQVAADPTSLTGRYLSGSLKVTGPNGGTRRPPKGWLEIQGARLFNLKNINAQIPLGVLTCVTGVSGSGKSSLIADTLHPALMRLLHGAQTTPGPYDRITGLDQLDKVINITQDPIGRTPRSNPATYVEVFAEIRKVFASTPEARARGYKSDRFSFNVKGGRCEACAGHGQKKIEMHFLPDVWVTCHECKGTRYNRQTLEITYKGKNIAEVLDLDVQEALDFFSTYPKIHRILQTLHDVGLDYVKLGQSATTLSGGEAQRVKLAKELSRIATGRTIYILDEPTTGLHFADIQRLLDVLHRLTDAGNTVIIIEHNLDVIKTADWIIDLGPEGGDTGGLIVAQGTPEDIACVDASFTGRYLRKVL